MNASIKNEPCSWSEDLMASRDLSKAEIEGFGFLLGWFEEWRLRVGLAPGRSAAERFWKEVVGGKARQEWQLDQWAAALGGYLRWLQLCVDAGGDGRGLAERMKAAARTTGARRGLALATRRTYAGWAGRSEPGLERSDG
jgi:hypothetical protein